MHEPSGVFLMIHTLLSDVWESGENRVSGAGKTCKAPAVGAWWASIQRGAVGCGPALSDNLPFQGSLVFFRQDYLRSRRWHEGIAAEASEVGEGQMSGPAGHLAGGCRQGVAEPVGRAAHQLRWTAAILCLGTILPASEVSALERLQRKFDLERGLPFSEVNSVKQDTRGFLWIATGGGLFRYDGVELRPWPRDSFRSLVRGLAAGPDGEVMFLGYTGTLHEVAGDGIRPVEGPGRKPLVAVGPPIWDAEGNFWVATADRLWFKPPGGEWREFPLARLAPQDSHFLVKAKDGRPIVITDNAIWRIDRGLDAVRIASMRGIQSALVRADGSAVLLLRGRVVG